MQELNDTWMRLEACQRDTSDALGALLKNTEMTGNAAQKVTLCLMLPLTRLPRMCVRSYDPETASYYLCTAWAGCFRQRHYTNPEKNIRGASGASTFARRAGSGNLDFAHVNNIFRYTVHDVLLT